MRATRYLLMGGVTSLAAAATLFGLAVTLVSCIVLIGLPFLPDVMRSVQHRASAERRRIHQLTGVAISDPYAPMSGTTLAQVRTLARDPTSYRDVAWLALHAAFGSALAGCWLLLGLFVVLGVATPMVWWALPAENTISYIVPVTNWPLALTVPPVTAVVGFALLRWGMPAVAMAQVQTYRSLLEPSLAHRVAELSATRAGALDAHAAELRRIERDLHDGAQARLVSVAIQLGVAQRQRAVDPDIADQLIEKARTGVEDALTELRGVVRSVYPPILADRGLSGAVHALAADCPVPLSVTIGPVGRLPAALESAAYFIIAEALTNVAKHSHATRADLRLDYDGHRLSIEVADNGTGGADAGNGTGLTGIQRRAAALDGHADVTSPPGGPTVVRAELPCGS